MLSIFKKYFFLLNFAKIQWFPSKFLPIYNLNVKQFGSQMRPHVLWGLIWIQIVCKGHQRSSKFAASKQRVNKRLRNYNRPEVLLDYIFLRVMRHENIANIYRLTK